MDSDETKISENVPPAYIFLPVCVQSNHDIFLSVLRSIIAKSGMDKNPVNISLITGMKHSTLQIEAEDVGPWNNLNSKSQQIRQGMMLGYWAMEHFPSLGKKLCGDTWKIPQRQSVQVVGGESITPDEFDALIFDKLKLRIIELRVSRSTLQRLKGFIKVPADIGKIDRIQLSKKMFSFDIQNGFDSQCWDALRLGGSRCGSVNELVDKPSTNTLLANTVIATDPEIYQSVINPNNLVKRLRRDRSLDTETATNDDMTTGSAKQRRRDRSMDTEIASNDDMTTGSAKQRRRDRSMDTEIASNDDMTTGSAKQRRRDRSMDIKTTPNAIDDMTTESLRTILIHMQKDLGDLTKWFIAGHNSEDDSPQRVYSKIIAEKDEIIVSLKKTVNDLGKEVKCVKDDNACLNGELKTNAGLIGALQKGVDANFTLYSNSEAKLTLLQDSIDKQQQIIITKEKELVTATTEIKTLRTQLNSSNNDADGIVPELRNRIKTLEQSLNEAANVKSIVAELQNRNEILERSLAESSACHVTVNEQLSEWKLYGSTKDGELAEAKIHAQGLQNQINVLNSDVETIVSQMKIQIESLERNLTESTAKNGALEHKLTELQNKNSDLERSVAESSACHVTVNEQLSEWKFYGSTKDGELAEAKMHAQGLQNQINILNSDVETIVSQMKIQIESLERNLTESTAKNGALEHKLTELQNKNSDLERSVAESSACHVTVNEQLSEWKFYGSTKDGELAEAKMHAQGLQNQINVLNSDVETIVSQMKIQIESLERNLTESTAKNGALEHKLTELQNKNSDLERSVAESSACHVTVNEQLSEWKFYGSTKDGELAEAKMHAQGLQNQINVLNSDVETIVSQMKIQIESLERNLTESTAKNGALEHKLTELQNKNSDLERSVAESSACHVTVNEQLSEWKFYGSTKDGELAEAKMHAQGLQNQINVLNSDVERIVNCGTTKEHTFLDVLPEVFSDDDPKCTAHMPTPGAGDLAKKLISDNLNDEIADFGQNPQHRYESQANESDDLIVIACKPVLMAQRFGWVTFETSIKGKSRTKAKSNKTSRPWPAFVYPPDADGLSRAQKVTSDGYVSDTKYNFSQYEENVPEKEKSKAAVKALNKFNEKFNLNFV